MPLKRGKPTVRYLTLTEERLGNQLWDSIRVTHTLSLYPSRNRLKEDFGNLIEWCQEQESGFDGIMGRGSRLGFFMKRGIGLMMKPN